MYCSEFTCTRIVNQDNKLPAKRFSIQNDGWHKTTEIKQISQITDHHIYELFVRQKKAQTALKAVNETLKHTVKSI